MAEKSDQNRSYLSYLQSGVHLNHFNDKVCLPQRSPKRGNFKTPLHNYRKQATGRCAQTTVMKSPGTTISRFPQTALTLCKFAHLFFSPSFSLGSGGRMYCVLQMFVLFLEAPETALCAKGRGGRRRSSSFGPFALREKRDHLPTQIYCLIMSVLPFHERLQSIFVLIVTINLILLFYARYHLIYYPF